MFCSSWLYNIARGIDTEPVKARIVAKSIGCCKNFKGYLALATKNDVKHWLAELCAEIYERLQDDLITVKLSYIGSEYFILNCEVPLHFYQVKI